MAEDSNSENILQQPFDIDAPAVETVYANTTHIIVGNGEVTLLFGYQPIEGINYPAIDVKRIVMTHDSFMRMMEFWSARYRLLESLYDGKPRTLRDIDGQTITAAFDIMLGRQSQEVNEDEPADVRADDADKESVKPSSTSGS